MLLKIYINIYRIGIIILLGLYILLMVAAASGGYGNSDPDLSDFVGFAYMFGVFAALTVFIRGKEGRAKNTARYVSLTLVLLLVAGFTALLVFVETSPEILFVHVLFTTLSGLLSFELIRYKSPKDIG